MENYGKFKNSNPEYHPASTSVVTSTQQSGAARPNDELQPPPDFNRTNCVDLSKSSPGTNNSSESQAGLDINEELKDKEN